MTYFPSYYVQFSKSILQLLSTGLYSSFSAHCLSWLLLGSSCLPDAFLWPRAYAHGDTEQKQRPTALMMASVQWQHHSVNHTSSETWLPTLENANWQDLYCLKMGLHHFFGEKKNLAIKQIYRDIYNMYINGIYKNNFLILFLILNFVCMCVWVWLCVCECCTCKGQKSVGSSGAEIIDGWQPVDMGARNQTKVP